MLMDADPKGFATVIVDKLKSEAPKQEDPVEMALESATMRLFDAFEKRDSKQGMLAIKDFLAISESVEPEQEMPEDMMG